MKEDRNKNIRKSVYIIIISLISIYCLRAITVVSSTKSKDKIYTVEFSFPEGGTKQIDRIITKPFENTICQLKNIREIRTVTDNNKVIVNLFFDSSENETNIEFRIRKILEQFYSQMPSNIHPPKLYANDNLSNADFVFCVFRNEKTDSSEFRKNLELYLKSLNGVSNIKISGDAMKDMYISLDECYGLKRKNLQKRFSDIIYDASILDFRFVAYDKSNSPIPFRVSTKAQNLDVLKSLQSVYEDGYFKPDSIAEVNFQFRECDEIIRINGKETIHVEIRFAKNIRNHNASNKCRRKISELLDEDEFKVLYDREEKQNVVIKGLLFSLCQSITAIIILFFLFWGISNSILYISFFIFLSTISSLAVMTVFGITIDQYCISGFIISLGLIVDPYLVISELYYDSNSKRDFQKRLKSEVKPLFLSFFTTLIVLIPVHKADRLIPGMGAVSKSICIMLFSSFLYSIILFPSFLETCSIKKKMNLKISYSIALKVSDRILVALYVICLICSFIFVGTVRKSIIPVEDSLALKIYSQFPSNRTASYIDGEMKGIVSDICRIKGVDYVMSNCSLGNGEMTVGIKNNDKKVINCINSILTSNNSVYGEGLFYICNDLSNKTDKIEICVQGIDSEECMKLAKRASEKINVIPNIKKSILNFRNDTEVFNLKNRNDSTVKSGLDSLSIFNQLYWKFSEPVIGKWNYNENETDVRLKEILYGGKSLENLMKAHIITECNSIPLTALCHIEKNKTQGKLYRRDGKQCVWFTVYHNSSSTEKILNSIKEEIKKIEIPDGYTFSFDDDIENMERDFSNIIILYLLSIFIIFMIISIFSEKIIESFVIVSIIPISSLFPVLIKILLSLPMTTGDFVGMVLAGGITVNNAIFHGCSENKHGKSILIANLTTLAGVVPIMLSSSSGFSRDLAFYTFFSCIGSMPFSCYVLPKVIGHCICFYKYFRREP